MPKTPPQGTYPVDNVIVKKRGKARDYTSLRQIRSAIGNDINVDDLSKNTVIVDYIANGEKHCSFGIVAPHKDGKSKLVVAATRGSDGILLEVRGKLMFEVG